MRTLLPQLMRWTEEKRRFALATVVKVSGSTPRSLGSTLIVAEDGLHFAGAVSSGCLENEVLEASPAVLSGDEVRVLRFGPGGVFPWDEGLTCGGHSEVRLEPWWGCSSNPAHQEVAAFVLQCMEADEGVFVLSAGPSHFACSQGGRAVGEKEAFSAATLAEAGQALQRGASSYSLSVEGADVFVRLIHKRRTLLLVGAVDLAVRITALATVLDYRTVVLDPRRAYATAERFSGAEPDLFLCGWPDALIPGLGLGKRDAALVLSHDPKIDDPALIALLEGRVAYIGALGSAGSHQKRLQRLGALGVSAEALQRIEGPAGIKLGIEAEAVALGIMAGVVRAHQARGA